MEEIKIESTTPELQAKYLSDYIENAIAQKVKLATLIQKYNEQYKKLTEDIIDQNDLIEYLKEDLKS